MKIGKMRSQLHFCSDRSLPPPRRVALVAGPVVVAEQGPARALARAEPAAQVWDQGTAEARVRDLEAAAILQPRPAVKGHRAARVRLTPGRL